MEVVLNGKFLVLVVVLWLWRRMSCLLELYLNVFQGNDGSGEQLILRWFRGKTSLHMVLATIFKFDIFQNKKLSFPTIKISKHKQQ